MLVKEAPGSTNDHQSVSFGSWFCNGAANFSEICHLTWWRHQMETFSALLALCAGNSSVTGEFPAQRPVTRSFDVFFDLRPNERLSKQSGHRWFETLSSSLWRHYNVSTLVDFKVWMVSLRFIWYSYIRSTIEDDFAKYLSCFAFRFVMR